MKAPVKIQCNCMKKSEPDQNSPFVFHRENKKGIGKNWNWTISSATLVTYFVQSTWTISKNTCFAEIYVRNTEKDLWRWRITSVVLWHRPKLLLSEGFRKSIPEHPWHFLSFKNGIFPLKTFVPWEIVRYSTISVIKAECCQELSRPWQRP